MKFQINNLTVLHYFTDEAFFLTHRQRRLLLTVVNLCQEFGPGSGLKECWS